MACLIDDSDRVSVMRVLWLWPQEDKASRRKVPFLTRPVVVALAANLYRQDAEFRESAIRGADHQPRFRVEKPKDVLSTCIPVRPQAQREVPVWCEEDVCVSPSLNVQTRMRGR